MLLKDYLLKYGTPITLFSERVGVTEATVYRLLQGSEPRLTIALKIEEVTDGEVKCRDLIGRKKGEAKSIWKRPGSKAGRPRQSKIIK